jgi:Flp pilus assembly pilin Flp
MTLLLTRFLLFFQNRLREERGATTVEYGMLLVGVVVLGGLFATVVVPAIGDWLKDTVPAAKP